MSSLSDAEVVVRASYEAFRAGDRAAQETFLADDFTFTSPHDDRIDRTAYFERCWPNHARVADFRIERVMPDEAGAFITYLFVTKDGAAFRNTEYLAVRDHQIVSADVYFGAAYRDGRFDANPPAEAASPRVMTEA
jgi:ketosteroid isomerase-like protein